MAGGKWIDGLAPTTPVRSAARAVLGQRFERVAKYLRRVGQAGVPGPENVHQLRVATRRAAAALSVFKASLPRKYRRGARKLLREIRRTASAARDWDVFAARFAPPGDGPGAAAGGARDALLGYALARRADAQAALDELARRCGGEWEAVCAGLPEAVQSPREGPVDLADHARDVLAPLFESLCEAAERPPASFEGMHAVRILGKKLRYAMEIFADCHAPPFRERLYPAVEAMQETLGALNDSLTGQGRIAAFMQELRRYQPQRWQRWAGELETILGEEKSRLSREAERFQVWCGEWRALVAEYPPARLVLTDSLAPARGGCEPPGVL